MPSSRYEKTSAKGIYRRHAAACAKTGGAKSGCHCSFEATVYSARERKLIRKRFEGFLEAKSWRQDAQVAVRGGRLRAPSPVTLAELADDLIAGMTDGRILDRSGKRYKPSTTRGYERVLRLHILPRLRTRKLSQIERRDLQRLVEELQAEGRSPSTIQNVLNPLQVICRRAVHDGTIAIDPTDGLLLPAVRGGRDKIASPDHARELIEALQEGERAFWATAFYAGLRRGELRALRWDRVDFDESVIRVERGWDDVEGEIEVKSDAGRRRVPLAGPLRTELAAHKLRTGGRADGLVFGRTPSEPFIPSTARSRARRAWEAENKRRVEETDDPSSVELLSPLTPHEARHTCASYLIAAGLNPKQLSVYIGHSDIRTTFNRYGHLMPGGEQEAADKLSAFLGGAAEAQA